MTKPLITSVIGIDPGETVGLGMLDYDQHKQLVGRTFLQADWNCAQFVLEALLSKYYHVDHAAVTAKFAGIEAFRTGNAAGTKGKPAELTRQLVFQFSEQLQLWGYHVELRAAVDVKLWATDKRLIAIGFPKNSNGGIKSSDLGHASDGARHALYCAKHDAFMPDPLR